MADRTPRFCWNNLVQAAATILTASASQAAFPVSRLKDQMRSKIWRAPIGWNVKAAINDKLDYSEGGSAKAATLAVGNYATGALFAAQVTTAMNAVAVSNTYLCSYDAGTGKFTIARASGAATISLLFGTGANLAASVAKDLGFIVADKTGATSYLADAASYHSREWIVVDLGSAQSVAVGIVINHNAMAGGTFRLQGNATNVWSAPSVDQTLAGGATMRIAFFTPGVYRYWRLLIEDTLNTDGFSEVGILFVGDYLQPDRSFAQGYKEQREQLSVMAQADQGASYLDKRPDRYAFRGQLARVSRATRDLLNAMSAAMPPGKNWFLAQDPQNFPSTETYYVSLTAPLDLIQSVGDGPTADRYETDVSVLEALG